MKVLGIGCHPDDIEVACAGTLAKYKKLGHEVTVCHVTNGDMGHVEIMPPELREMRIAEAKKAGALAGIKVVTLDIGDLVVYSSDRKQRDAVVEVLRQEQPDVIITHSPNDYMPDHTAVSRLVFDASFAASCLHYNQGLPAAPITPIYYMDTLAGVGFMPTEYVDISDTIELKIEMLECHVSQLKWMRDHDNIDFAEFVRTCARFRGLQCGVQYAEAFTACNVWPRMVPKRMLP
ncbi:MAG: PIG-L family deacetylase [Clostridiales bacterium]|nr:PIG-L family deacetylase [Clostridiales bacterium]